MVDTEDDGWGPALAVIAQMRKPEPFVEPPPTPSQVLLQEVLQQQQNAANQRWLMMQQNACHAASTNTSALFADVAENTSSSWLLWEGELSSSSVAARRIERRM